MKKRRRVAAALLALMLGITGIPAVQQARASELAGAQNRVSQGGGVETASDSKDTGGQAGAEDRIETGGGADSDQAGADITGTEDRSEQFETGTTGEADKDETGAAGSQVEADTTGTEDRSEQSEAGTTGEADQAEAGTTGTEDQAGTADTEAENAANQAESAAGEDKAAESGSETAESGNVPAQAEDIRYNLGDFEYRMMDYAELEKLYAEAEKRAGEGDGSMLEELLHCQAYGEDSNYTIELEQNAFFPYEVQFTENGTVTQAWFMTPEDTVTVGGHAFSVHSQTDGTAVTQMSLNVAGETVVVYPEKKSFTNDGQGPAAAVSLLPLKTDKFEVDLSKYTPVELTRVSIDEVFSGDRALNKEKVIWTYSGDDDYKINQKGDLLDLSFGYGETSRWEMIVGEADQLEKNNIRYKVTVKVTPPGNWMESVVFFQKATGMRMEGQARTSYSSYHSNRTRLKGGMWVYIADNLTFGNIQYEDSITAYISLRVDEKRYSEKKYSALRAFEGEYDPFSGDTPKEITGQLFASNMEGKNAGYLVDRGYGRIVTIVSYDAAGSVTGVLPFVLRINDENGDVDLRHIQKDGKSVYDRSSIQEQSANYKREKIVLRSGFSAGDEYAYSFWYSKLGVTTSSAITAAYAGDYASIAEAQAAKAENVKDKLFGEQGYSTKEHTFTFFGGEGGAERYKYEIVLEEGTSKPEVSDRLESSSTYVFFEGLIDSEGKKIDNVRIYDDDYDMAYDSYVENGYITILTDTADLSHLSLDFWESSGVVLYSEDGRRVESGKTYFDFSKGFIQFTAASENKTYQKNYWVQVINPNESTGAKRLYVNSLVDKDAHTKEEGGVIYSEREVMLDTLYNYQHDILLVNRGKVPIDKLSAELTSDVVELDSYWTLKGKNSLDGFTTAEELSNLAKIRIKAKSSAAPGTEVSGTLTIKSGDTKLMVLTLTGTVGDPTITTDKIPQSVKYVPYGTMIQNSNKYDWNKVSYQLVSGKLPGGVELRENGEIYGVPKEFGEFKFWVRMDNSYSLFSSSSREFTLTVVDNTDENVENATHEGYTLSERVGDVYTSDSSQYLVVSKGEFAEFQDIYLDGEKLVKGTDYTVESGSTRITIAAQTLKKDGKEGKHTLGIEFRDKEKEVKAAAQNYTVKQKVNYDNNYNGGGNSSSDSNNSSSSSGTGNNSSTGSNSSGSGNNSSGTGSNSSNSAGKDFTDNGGDSSETGKIDSDRTESTSNSVVEILTKAARLSKVKKPDAAVLQRLFGKRSIGRGRDILLEVIDRLLISGK